MKKLLFLFLFLLFVGCASNRPVCDSSLNVLTNDLCWHIYSEDGTSVLVNCRTDDQIQMVLDGKEWKVTR